MRPSLLAGVLVLAAACVDAQRNVSSTEAGTGGSRSTPQPGKGITSRAEAGRPGGGSEGGDSGVDGALSGGGEGGEPSEPECPKAPGQICHEFFVTDSARNHVAYVNEFEPTKSWTTPVNVAGVNSPRQLQLVDNAASSTGKAILVSVDYGYQEYDVVTAARLVNVVVPGMTRVRGAVRLPTGNTLLAIDDKLRVVDNNGATVGTECALPGGDASLSMIAHNDSTGQILVGRLLDVFIVTETCKQQWTATLPTGGSTSSVMLQAGGGVWVSTGALATLLEYDEAGQVVRQMGGKDAHPDLGLESFAGFDLRPNGNLVVANSLRVPSGEETAHVIELTPDNALVWQWGNQYVARQIVDVHVLR